MKKVWSFAEPPAAAPDVPGMHPISGVLLGRRGIETAEEADAFFRQAWETDTHDPFLFSQMGDAVDRVFLSLENGERMTVHGDYDADGVTGSAIVISALRKLEQTMNGTAGSASLVDSYIPHRDSEGYGLRMETVPILVNRGTKLLITVDCGISCVDEIALAKEEGIETIVLDHHRFGETLPDAILIHPSLPGETYPFKHLAAGGVAWKFAAALMARGRERGLTIEDGWEKWLLDLAAIATVADMVPLNGENRTLLSYGLLVLNKTRRPGLRSLIESARVNRGSVTSETVGFALGPRINAAGRMDHASRALELLLAADDGEARERAAGIESLNRLRQAKTRGMMDTVEELLDREGVRPVVGLSDPAWPPALVGLVAGRVADRYARPCVAIGKHGGQWIGSGRSPQPIDITALVERAGKGLLRRSGGHAQACGFALDTDDAVTAFLANLDAEGERIQNELRSGPEIAIDAILQLPDLTWGLLESLRRFEPFGMGNPKPVFCTRELRILTADRVGKNGDHLRMTLADGNGKKRPFIGFRFGERVSETRLGMSIDVVYDVTANVWNGREELSCRLVDFRESGT